jgi:hypothetical protein
MATLITAGSGESEPRELGSIILLPGIDAFQLSDEPAGGSSYFATLEGHDLESIARVGWDAQTGLPVEAIPAPVAGKGDKERLRIAMPWPAPSPHAPLYIWLTAAKTAAGSRHRATESADAHRSGAFSG